MRKTIGVISSPTFGKVTTDFMMAYSSIQKPLASTWIPYNPRNMRIDHARNDTIDYALSIGAEYILFIDDDVLVPGDILLKMLERHKDIVNGVYVAKSDAGIMPLIFREQVSGPYMDWKIGEFFQIDSAGMGATLINTRIFKKLEKPYFDINFNLSGMGDNRYGQGTEDLYFYGKCRKAGVEVWADTSIQCGHIDINSGKVYGIPASHPVITGEKRYDSTDVEVLDLGSGPLIDNYAYFGDNAKVTRVDIREEVKPDVRMDIRKLYGLRDEYYDIVNASNVLQYFNHRIARDLIQEWFTKVKVGGKLRVIVPDLLVIMQKCIELGDIPEQLQNIIWGGQFHKKDLAFTGFTEKSLKNLFSSDIHGADLLKLKIVHDNTGLFLEATIERVKTSKGFKDNGVQMNNYLYQKYEMFAINNKNEYVYRGEPVKIMENYKDLIGVGFNGVISGDQIVFNLPLRKWFRNGHFIDNVPEIDDDRMFELFYQLPKDEDTLDINTIYTLGYRISGKSVSARITSDGDLSFNEHLKIKKDKIKVKADE